MDKRYIFIVNPASGAGKGEIIAGLLRKLLPAHPRLGGGMAEVVLTGGVDASELSEKLSRADVAVAVGGDGTVSHLLPHLLACERPPAVGLIPLGTSNDLARTLGASMTDKYTSEDVLLAALDRLLSAREEKLDVFRVNDDLLFCNYFSVGFDAAIVRDFDSFRGSRWVKSLPAGRLTNNILYFLVGLKNARFRLPSPIEIECSGDGKSYRVRSNSPCAAIIVSNLPVYAGGARIAPDALKDDGAFEITVVPGLFDYVRLILTRFIPFLGLPRGLGRYRGKEASIRLHSPVPSQVDGERCAETDVPKPSLTISFHASLRVLAVDPSM
jgi:diacylglycerol kinase family enzyme